MNSKLRNTLLLVVTLVAALTFFSLRRPVKTQSPPAVGLELAGPPDATPALADPNSEPASHAAPHSTQTPPVLRMTQAQITTAIEATLADLRSGDRVKMKAALDRLDALLGSESRDTPACIAAIEAFLRSGRDAATGEDFMVGEGGALSGASTLRVMLMDHLGTLCRESGSKVALNVAAEVMSRFGSADEWAVCLRNTAWLDAGSTATLQTKMQQMLNHQPWVNKPSSGMLEAFDVAAYSGATQLIPRLNEFLTKGEQDPLWRASTIALDQLATSHPGEVLDWLAHNPTAMQDHPNQRADLFAKADLNNPSQRQAIEAILARQDLSVEERSKILAGIVTPGSFMSSNLLTQPTPFTLESEQTRLALVQRIGKEWQTAGKFPDLTTYVNDLVTRSASAK